MPTSRSSYRRLPWLAAVLAVAATSTPLLHGLATTAPTATPAPLQREGGDVPAVGAGRRTVTSAVAPAAGNPPADHEDGLPVPATTSSTSPPPVSGTSTPAGGPAIAPAVTPMIDAAAAMVGGTLADAPGAVSANRRPPGKGTGAVPTTTAPSTTTTTAAAPTTTTTVPAPAPRSGLSWSTVFDGYGWVRYGLAPEVAMAPMASTQPNETHASLVRSTTNHGDLDLSLRMRTVRQLRTGSTPNPWEVAWAIWNYTDNEHFSYLILKPNGWELGKADPAYPGAQRFLATGETPFPIGPAYTVRVRQVDNVVTVWADGRQLVTFADQERPYLGGAIALYNEDAEVEFDGVSVIDL